MNTNNDDIVGQIHRVREKQAAECDFDPKRIGERMRLRQREREARGVRYASFANHGDAEKASRRVREKPPGT